MALKIDRKEGSLSSLDEMRVHVIFQQSNGQVVGNSTNTDPVTEPIWVADSIGDLPCTGDFISLTENDRATEITSSKSNYKVISRNIDLNAFANNEGRIVCIINVEKQTI